MNISELKGIGPSRLKAFHAAGISSLRELLYTQPVSYRDTRAAVPVAEARDGERVLMALRCLEESKVSFHGKLSRVSCRFSDNSGEITVCWFNQLWMRAKCVPGTELRLYGTVKRFGSGKQLINPVLSAESGLIPVYRPIEGVPQKLHLSLVRQALPMAEQLCPETLPASLLERHELVGLSQAMLWLHQPETPQQADAARRRFAFEQMLLYQAAVRSAKDIRPAAPPIPADEQALAAFWQQMPFAPTGAQARCLREISSDLRKTTAMARMVQGDVGSGKTAVAAGAMHLCVRAGYQALLMAPTEILARQHYESLSAFFAKQGIGCGLLVGGMRVKERREALENIRSGAWRVVIGTHALISADVIYESVGLCITDEQHRFGVRQRAALQSKGGTDGLVPHLLVMSATPIPRSLALILYGDLDLSVIDELPPGRKPVQTRIVPQEKREDMFAFIRRELDSGRQAYFVCPLVESDENADSLKAAKDYAEQLRSGAFAGYGVGLTYGTQSAADKAEALRAFSAGETKVLVATTVIEVGVNVPNATVMVIEDAERFGLAQLHQLRGRVGRGDAQSWCFLMADANERLRTLCRTNDGFEVAKDDLEQRGPGELLGVRQSGAALWPGAAMMDSRLLYEAAQCAEELQSQPAYREEWNTVKRLSEQMLNAVRNEISIS